MIREQISKALRLDRAYVELLIRSASHRYKRYRIPKRTGGSRIIDHPAKELKLIQKWLCKKYLSYLHIHSSVFSYKSNVNIRMHAEKHVKNNYLLRIDFKDFFPSIGARNIQSLLSRHVDHFAHRLSEDDIEDIVKLVCRFGSLTIGAPSSPVLSNAVLYNFDSRMFEYCEGLDVMYTRYADDIYMSTKKPDVLADIYEIFPTRLDEWTDLPLQINRDKTVFTSRKHERRVTGLVLTPSKEISVGRDKKRYIKSLVYRYKQNTLVSGEESFLRGYVAYINSVEPSFLEVLRRKYGSDTIDSILDSKLVSRKKR